MNEQKIREAFEKHCNGDEQYFDEVSFSAGYMALLNELERMGSQQVVSVKTGKSKNAALYMLPEGVTK